MPKLSSAPRVWRLLLTALLAAGLLSGCASRRSDAKDATAEEVYAEARSDMQAGIFDSAIRNLNRVEALGGGTLLAQQAQLDLAYVQWRTNERESALMTLDRFVKYNPSSPALDYALYMRGVVNFNDSLGLFGSIARQNLAERDQAASRDAWQAFKQLVDQFPDSPYSADARLRMTYIANSLALHEVFVARYYFRRGAWLAAANRAQQTVAEFQTAPAAEEALYIMAASYERLELPALRDAARRVLSTNFPGSRYLKHGLADPDEAWWKFW